MTVNLVLHPFLAAIIVFLPSLVPPRNTKLCHQDAEHGARRRGDKRCWMMKTPGANFDSLSFPSC